MGRLKGVEMGIREGGASFCNFFFFHLDFLLVIFNTSTYGLSHLLCINLFREPRTNFITQGDTDRKNNTADTVPSSHYNFG